MTRVCLDTTALSDAIREHEGVRAKLTELERAGASFVTTTVNIFEASVGVLRIPSSAARTRAFARLRALLEGLDVADFDLDAAMDGAKVMVRLFEPGRPAPALDLMTAVAAARAGCDTVLTRNERQFQRIGALHVVGY